jgi:iron complex outermembrane recepter protein
MYCPQWDRKFGKVIRMIGETGRAFALLCVSAGASHSAELSGTAAAPASGDMLAEVVITATKRASTVQDTPISVTAVSAEELADRGITSFIELAQSVPGISMRTSGSGQTEFEMRGLQSSGGSSSTVGFYLDEIPLSSPASAQNGKVVIDPSLYDLARVEILRGPQGTLYGSGSMGGTVKLLPHDPELGKLYASGETVVSDTASGGSINIAQNGMVNLPVGDTAAIRLVGSSSQTSGWVQRIVIQPGEFPLAYTNASGTLVRGNVAAAPVATDYSNSNSATLASARMSVLWNPNERLSVAAMFMYQNATQAGPSATDTSGIYPSATGVEAHYEPFDIPEPYYDRFGFGSLKLTYQAEGVSITSATGLRNRNSSITQDGSEETATSDASLLPHATGYEVSQGGAGAEPAGQPGIRPYRTVQRRAAIRVQLGFRLPMAGRSFLLKPGEPLDLYLRPTGSAAGTA